MSECPWTIETLKQHFEKLREADREAVEAALVSLKELLSTMHIASQEAIEKAEASQLRYNVAHNDLSHKMEEQYKRMMPREESLSNYRNLNEKLEEQRGTIAMLQTRLDEIRGKSTGIQSFYGWIIAAVAVVIALLGYLKK